MSSTTTTSTASRHPRGFRASTKRKSIKAKPIVPEAEPGIVAPVEAEVVAPVEAEQAEQVGVEPGDLPLDYAALIEWKARREAGREPSPFQRARNRTRAALIASGELRILRVRGESMIVSAPTPPPRN